MIDLSLPSHPIRWRRAALILFFSVLLLASGAAKLTDVPGYARLLADWRVIPVSMTGGVALILGLSEFTAGLNLLAGGRRRRSGATIALVLMSFYVALDVQALFRHLDVPNTGTFGVHAAARLTGARLILDGVVLALAVLLRRFQNRRASDHRAMENPVRWVARR